MRLNTERLKRAAREFASRATTLAVIVALMLVLGAAGSEDMAEQQRAARAYSERVCASLHADYKGSRPDCEQVAGK